MRSFAEVFAVAFFEGRGIEVKISGEVFPDVVRSNFSFASTTHFSLSFTSQRKQFSLIDLDPLKKA